MNYMIKVNKVINGGLVIKMDEATAETVLKLIKAIDESVIPGEAFQVMNELHDQIDAVLNE